MILMTAALKTFSVFVTNTSGMYELAVWALRHGILIALKSYNSAVRHMLPTEIQLPSRFHVVFSSLYPPGAEDWSAHFNYSDKKVKHSLSCWTLITVQILTDSSRVIYLLHCLWFKMFNMRCWVGRLCFGFWILPQSSHCNCVEEGRQSAGLNQEQAGVMTEKHKHRGKPDYNWKTQTCLQSLASYPDYE